MISKFQIETTVGRKQSRVNQCIHYEKKVYKDFSDKCTVLNLKNVLKIMRKYSIISKTFMYVNIFYFILHDTIHSHL